MHTRTRQVPVPGATLAVTRSGDGPALVLVHGFGLDRRVWAPQLASLETRFEIIRYDLRGFGQSTLPDTGPYAHHEDLLALLDALRIERAHLLGHSLGGSIAASLALAAPQRVGRLLLAAPLLRGFVPLDALLTVLKQVWQAGAAGGVDGARTAWAQAPLLGAALQIPAARAVLAPILADYHGWHWLHRDPETGLNPPVAARLADITAPTLALVGALDLPDFHRMAQAIAQQTPDARLTVLPGVGHMPGLEAAATFNEQVLTFLTAPDIHPGT